MTRWRGIYMIKEHFSSNREKLHNPCHFLLSLLSRMDLSPLSSSIGGADYGSVRIGAFMGREMIRSTASATLSKSQSIASVANTDELEESTEPLEAEKSLEYLCNLCPHRYESNYAKILPEVMLGDTFLEKYVDHCDPVTIIDRKRNYGVKAAAKHPIYENFRVKWLKCEQKATPLLFQLSPSSPKR